MRIEDILPVNLFKTRKSFLWSYIGIFGFFYMIVPLFFMGDTVELDISLKLALATAISIIGFSIGMLVNFFPNIKKKYIFINFNNYSWTVFIIYFFIVTLIISTAGQIPLIASLSGASQADIFILREVFLKDRKGFEAIYSYLITLVDTTFFPLVIIYSIIIKTRYRYLFILIFALYSISFLEKGYFLKIGIPLFFYYYYKAKSKKTYLIVSGSFLLTIILAMFLLSKFDTSDVIRDEPFFSILYTPTTVFQAIVWRMVAVPVITAYQGFELFLSTAYNGQYFMGATSSLLSSIFGLERINFERALYQSQFGGSETANANQFYAVEAFINYGYIGVLMFSYFLGLIVKNMINTRNIAIICLIPVLYYNLFSSGLIGNLLSNGFLFFYLFITNVKIQK